MTNGMYISQNSAVKRVAMCGISELYGLLHFGLRQYARKSCGDVVRYASRIRNAVISAGVPGSVPIAVASAAGPR